MSNQQVPKAFLGSGRIYFKNLSSSTNPEYFVGNATGFQIQTSSDSKKLQDRTSSVGGVWASTELLTDVNVTISLSDFNRENLSLALLSEIVDNAAETVTESFYTNPETLESVFVTEKPIDGNITLTTPTTTIFANSTAYVVGDYLEPSVSNGFYYKVTTAGTSGGAAPSFPTTVGSTVTSGSIVLTCAGKTTLVEDTDYSIKSDFEIEVVAGTFILGELIEVEYDTKLSVQYETLIKKPQSIKIKYVAENGVNSNDNFLYVFHKTLFSVTKQLDLLSADFGNLELSGSLQKVTRGSGLSGFITVVNSRISD